MESLFIGSKTMVALSLAELPGNGGHFVLAMGGLDNKIHLYCGQRTGNVCSTRCTYVCRPVSFVFQLILCSYLLYVPVCSCLSVKRTS